MAYPPHYQDAPWQPDEDQFEDVFEIVVQVDPEGAPLVRVMWAWYQTTEAPPGKPLTAFQHALRGIVNGYNGVHRAVHGQHGIECHVPWWRHSPNTVAKRLAHGLSELEEDEAVELELGMPVRVRLAPPTELVLIACQRPRT